jgi:hypothetical protein
MRAKISLCNAVKLLSLFAFAVYLAGAGSEVLRVEGATGRDGVAKPALSLSLEDLASMPHVTARVHTRDGAERTYEGVLLSEVLKRTRQPRGEDLRGSLLSKYVLAARTGCVL